MQLAETQSTGSVIVQGTATVALMSLIKEIYTDMLPFLVIAAVIVFVDLLFGIKAARKRGEVVRWPRAFRRTLGKLFEYVCWITVSTTIAVGFGVRSIETIILGFVVAIELWSIVSNWAEIRGLRIRGLNIPKIIGDKIGVDLSDVKIDREEGNEDK